MKSKIILTKKKTILSLFDKYCSAVKFIELTLQNVNEYLLRNSNTQHSKSIFNWMPLNNNLTIETKVSRISFETKSLYKTD